MKEIGGYLGLEQLPQHEYYPDLIALNSARNALLYLCRAKRIQKLFLPYLLCNVVGELCVEASISVTYYHTGTDLLPDLLPDCLSDGDWVYIVNYYGRLNPSCLLSLQARYGRIILDHTHAFFQPPCNGIDTIYSCRKFFGVPDGAYLATDVRLPEELARDHSIGRMEHLLGRFEYDGASYFDAFRKNDDSLCGEPLLAMSRITHNILGAIDYADVRTKRNENYLHLAHRLDGVNGLASMRPDGPFAYPLYCKDAARCRKELIAQKIYVPLLWPNVLTLDDCPVEKDLAVNILPLPCDQRYTPDDMQIILDALHQLDLC